MINYGENLKNIRHFYKKTLLEVQKDTGISNQNISRWEQGKVLPNIDFCVKLADYYGISLDELVGRDFPSKNTITNSFNNNSGNINFNSK